MLDIQALEQQIAEQMATHQIPGLALAVVHNGQTIYANGFGTTSVEENGTPVTANTIFRIASVTKPLAGTAIMRLVQAGKLDLDKPLVHYLPWLRFSRPGAEAVITLRMLLSHTSGLDFTNKFIGSRDPEGAERWAREFIPTISFVAEPGKVFNYSNAGVSLATNIAAALYGKPAAAMIEELVFAPLGMERSTFDPLLALTYPFAFSHERHPDGMLAVMRPVIENTAEHGAGYAMTTAIDMAKFAIMQMDGGRAGDQQLLTPESIQTMQTMHAPHYTVDGHGYGITFFTESYKGLQRVVHGGGIHGYHSAFDMLPEARTAVYVVGSRPAPPGVLLKIINDIFDQVLDLPSDVPATPEPTPIEPDRSTWPALTGQYISRAGIITITADGDHLTLERMGEKIALQTHSNNVYFWRNTRRNTIASVGFVPEADGSPSRYLITEVMTAARFEPDPAFQPNQAILKAHSGSYLGPANGRREIRLWVGDDGRLWATFAWYPGKEFPCTPLNSDTSFATGGGLFTIEESALFINGWRMPKAAS